MEVEIGAAVGRFGVGVGAVGLTSDARHAIASNRAIHTRASLCIKSLFTAEVMWTSPRGNLYPPYPGVNRLDSFRPRPNVGSIQRRKRHNRIRFDLDERAPSVPATSPPTPPGARPCRHSALQSSRSSRCIVKQPRGGATRVTGAGLIPGLEPEETTTGFLEAPQSSPCKIRRNHAYHTGRLAVPGL